jgi:hypothetical protein
VGVGFDRCEQHDDFVQAVECLSEIQRAYASIFDLSKVIEYRLLVVA